MLNQLLIKPYASGLSVFSISGNPLILLRIGKNLLHFNLFIKLIVIGLHILVQCPHNSFFSLKYVIYTHTLQCHNRQEEK